MSKHEQAERVIVQLNKIGMAESSYEYGLPLYNEARYEQMINAVLDEFDPRESETRQTSDPPAVVDEPEGPKKTTGKGYIPVTVYLPWRDYESVKQDAEYDERFVGEQILSMLRSKIRGGGGEKEGAEDMVPKRLYNLLKQDCNELEENMRTFAKIKADPPIVYDQAMREAGDKLVAAVSRIAGLTMEPSVNERSFRATVNREAFDAIRKYQKAIGGEE